MTTRIPLVNLLGTVAELPNGDELATAALASVTQILGYTPANILEVEANTRAARVTYRAQAGGPAEEMAYCISEHSLGMTFEHSATTTWPAYAEVMTAGNPGMPMISMLRKMTVGAATKAVTGARLGVSKLELYQIYPLVGMGQTFQWILPSLTTLPAPSALVTQVGNTKSLRCTQDNPLWIVQGAFSIAPAATTAVGVVTTSKPVGVAQGEAKSAIGTNIVPSVVFDHMAAGPLVLPPFSGLVLGAIFPAAVTSQTVDYFVNMQWTEWQARMPR